MKVIELDMWGNSGIWMLQPFTSPSFFDDPYDDTLLDLWKSPKMPSLATDKIVRPNEYIYKFDMPGYSRNDIQIKLDTRKKQLIIEGRKQHHNEGTSSRTEGLHGSYGYSLCSVGRVQKTISLDADTVDDPIHVHVELENGVLTVVFPREQHAYSQKNKHVKNIPITHRKNTNSPPA